MTEAQMVYVDCSPLMRSLLDEIGPPGSMKVYEGDPSPSELAALMANAAVVLNGHTKMDDAQLARAPLLRSIVFLGTGAASYVDLAAADRRGIRVRTIRGYGDRTVAEHAFALLLAAARDIAAMDRNMRAGRWAVSEGIELRGLTLGVIGLGGVGSEMARIGASFGMHVIAWNRSGVPTDVPARSVALEELLGASDAVSLHLALVPETNGLLNASRLALLKPGAVLINTARGALVDEAALIAALRSGAIGHAALDVFSREPLPARHPLTLLPNVTLTAHAGWKSRQASDRLLRIALDLAIDDAGKVATSQPLST